MFKLYYWSFGHFVSILLPIIIIAIFYLILRKRSLKTQKTVILILIFLNVIQHLFKPFIWYKLYPLETYDIRNSTFCNVCATSILLSPFMFLGKNEAFKDTGFYLGILGGIGSLWFISYLYGYSILSIDFIRYFTTHAILMTTSALPVLLGIQKLKMKNFWKVGLFFLGYETLVFLDNFIIVAFKNGFDWKSAYQLVYNENQLYIMHAPSTEIFNSKLLQQLHIKYVIDDGTCFYIPVIWSAPALYPFFCGVASLTTFVFSKIKLDGHYLGELYPKKNKEVA